MRKIIACEFMTLDGVIPNEENDGDGFKYGGGVFLYLLLLMVAHRTRNRIAKSAFYLNVLVESMPQACSPHEENYELETKHEDNSFCHDDAPDSAPFGCRIGAAKTNNGLCAG